MRIINTSITDPKSLTPFEREQVYNGLDVCITAEVLDCILPQLDESSQTRYDFARALQGPVLEMRLRGMLVDQAAKVNVIEAYHEQLDQLERQLERIVREGLGFFGFNWRSNNDLHRLFYQELRLPVVRKQGRPTVNREALERMEQYLVARPIVAHMLLMRDIGKKISVLKTEIDPDGRVRTSYNIAGTDTDRFSSSFSEFGTGTNLQNIEELLRRVFISDPGKKLAYIDAAQIQSRIVGAIEWNLFKDAKYLDACESGDLHTYVARLCEPKWPWTGELLVDKEIAERPYYRHYDLRKLCKSIGHGSNFGGGPSTLCKMYKVPEPAIAKFQQVYFPTFPAHHQWHEWVEEQIRSVGMLTSITGRKRQFWGRRDAQDTVRQAIAYDPQCTEAYIVNNGMLKVWKARDAELLLQNHDAIVAQYPEEMEDEVLPKLLEQLRTPIDIGHGRQLDVPFEAKTGWNWGNWHVRENTDGLKVWKPGDKRKRSPKVNILDRVVRSLHR